MDDLEPVLHRLSPFALLDVVPDSLRGWVLGVAWDLDALWRLELPERSLPVATLAWHLWLPWWRDGDRPFRVRPIEVFCRPDAFPDHVRRTEACDLSYPAHVVHRHDRWMILDGVHRLLKACLLGYDSLEVRVVSPADVARIASVDAAWDISAPPP